MSDDCTGHGDEAVELYDYHSPRYWRSVYYFAAVMISFTTRGPLLDYYSTIRRKKSARARKAPKYPLLVFDWCSWSDIQHVKLSADDDNYEVRVVGEYTMEEGPPVFYMSRDWDRLRVRMNHPDIFGPFIPEENHSPCPSGSVLMIGDTYDLYKATRIYHPERLTDKQLSRLTTFSSWPGYYSLRPHKHRKESLSVREWNRAWREASCCDRIKMYLDRYGPVTLKPFKPIWTVPLQLQTRHQLVPLAIPEQMARYRYPNGPAEEKK